MTTQLDLRTDSWLRSAVGWEPIALAIGAGLVIGAALFAVLRGSDR